MTTGPFLTMYAIYSHIELDGREVNLQHIPESSPLRSVNSQSVCLRVAEFPCTFVSSSKKLAFKFLLENNYGYRAMHPKCGF